MDDDHIVEQVARQMHERHGPDAAPRAREQAEIADGIGDPLSADAWRDIANALKRLQTP
jgi:hypothetical protein